MARWRDSFMRASAFSLTRYVTTSTTRVLNNDLTVLARAVAKAVRVWRRDWECPRAPAPISYIRELLTDWWNLFASPRALMALAVSPKISGERPAVVDQTDLRST